MTSPTTIRIAQLWNMGLPAAQIALEVGISEGSVFNTVSRLRHDSGWALAYRTEPADRRPWWRDYSNERRAA